MTLAFDETSVDVARWGGGGRLPDLLATWCRLSVGLRATLSHRAGAGWDGGPCLSRRRARSHPQLGWDGALFVAAPCEVAPPVGALLVAAPCARSPRMAVVREMHEILDMEYRGLVAAAVFVPLCQLVLTRKGLGRARISWVQVRLRDTCSRISARRR